MNVEQAERRKKGGAMKLRTWVAFVGVGLFLLMVPFTAVATNVTPHIGVVVTSMGSLTQARIANFIQKYATGLGWSVTVLDSEMSNETQATNVTNLVQMRVDAIVMAMGHPQEIKVAMQKAFDVGIPVITIDTGYMDGVVTDIATNNYIMSAKITNYMLDQIGYAGNIIAFKFEKHFGVRRRGKVLDVILSESPAVKLLATHYMPAAPNYIEDTRNAMESYVLQFDGKINAVWCGFDELGYAVDDVLQAHGYTRKDVIIVGIDGNQETFRRIRDPNSCFLATVAQPFELEAKKAVDIIQELVVEGKPIDEVVSESTTYVDAPLVDRRNVPKEAGEWPW